MSNTFACRIQRRQLETAVLASARAAGCTCNPDIECPPLVRGALRSVCVSHEDDCLHELTSAAELKVHQRINRGEFDRHG